jgi:hypothetical protein
MQPWSQFDPNATESATLNPMPECSGRGSETCAECAYNNGMAEFSVLSDEFLRNAQAAARKAREAALRAGQSVVFIDEAGRYVEERPDGRLFEIRIDPSRPPESRRVVVRELGTTAA